jgi:hypothetical protein
MIYNNLQGILYSGDGCSRLVLVADEEREDRLPDTQGKHKHRQSSCSERAQPFEEQTQDRPKDLYPIDEESKEGID